MKNACQYQPKTANQKHLYGIESGPGSEDTKLPLLLPEIVVDTKAEVENLAGVLSLLVMKEFMKDEIERMVGSRYEHQEGRQFSRWGKQGGSVVFAGRKVRIDKPRVRDLRTKKEAKIESYDRFRQGEKLSEAIAGKLLLGVSSRDYHRSIETFAEGYGIAKSSVSRAFIKATKKRLERLTERSFVGTEFVVVMIDGIEYQGHLVVVAVGITMDGKKQVLGLRLGATENAVVVTDLLASLVERGFDPLRPMLFVLDGAKALLKAVRSHWGGRAVIQRCQVHKLRNIRGYLPEEHQGEILGLIRKAYAMEEFDKAKASLLATVRRLKLLSPDAAESLKEGLEETLTVHRLGLRGALRKTLATTNIIENCQGTTRRLSRNVKRWRDGAMVQRWIGCTLLAAEERFNRIKGHRDLVSVRGALTELVLGTNIDSCAMVA